MGTEEESAEDDHPILKGLDEMTGVNLLHRGADTDIELDAEEESLGTLVWFGLVGPAIELSRERHGAVGRRTGLEPTPRPCRAPSSDVPESGEEPKASATRVQLT